MAFGKAKYIRQAENLALSLKHHMPELPIALITDAESIDETLFAHRIPLCPAYPKGVLQKLNLYDCSPFDETLYIDSDCICTKPFHNHIEALRQGEFTAVGSQFRQRGDSEQYLDNLTQTLDKLGLARFPKFNGGFYYFPKTPKSRKVFEDAKQFLERRKELGIRNFNSAGANEETLFSLAIENQKLPTYFDHGMLMRTPLGVKGRIHLDPLGDGCAFQKGQILMKPALIHFCGPLAKSHEYQFCETVYRKKPNPQDYEKLKKRLYWKQNLISLPFQKLANNRFIIQAYTNHVARKRKKTAQSL